MSTSGRIDEGRTYIFKHQNIDVALIQTDRDFYQIMEITKVFVPEHLPPGTVDVAGRADKRLLGRWLFGRSIPASRPNLESLLSELGLSYAGQLAERAYCLSLSDQYWLCPAGEHLRWEDINFFDHPFSEDIGHFLLEGDDSGSMNLHSPDNSSDGELRKCWRAEGDRRILVKGGTAPYYQEPYNEVIASELFARLGLPHVTYQILHNETQHLCTCEDFVTRDTEYIPAKHLLNLRRKRNDESDYRHLVECYRVLGIEDTEERLGEMILTDYILANTDRHYGNFGIVRRADTLQVLGVNPLFDSGNSLWFDTATPAIKPFRDVPAKPFRKTQDAQLEFALPAAWFDVGKLDGIDDKAAAVLTTNENLSGERVERIVKGLRVRIAKLEEKAEKRLI